MTCSRSGLKRGGVVYARSTPARAQAPPIAIGRVSRLLSSVSGAMKRLARIAILAAAALAIAAAPDETWARQGGGGHGSGARGGSHHNHHARSSGGFFVGSPFWYSYYYGPPPYYYGPDYSNPQYGPPTVYVEKFEGTPTSETQGEIFCPDRGAYYPEVQDCSGGWQRVFQAAALPD